MKKGTMMPIVQAAMTAMYTRCAPSSAPPPPAAHPPARSASAAPPGGGPNQRVTMPASANAAAPSIPQAPQPACTAMASSGSSTLRRTSRARLQA